MSSRIPDYSSGKASVFKYQGQAYLLIAVSVICGLFLFLSIAGAIGSHGPVSLGELIIFGCFLFFLLLAILILRQQSNIVVDDKSISRCFWGWKWQKIPWDGVRVIRVAPYFHPVERKIVRVLNIYPTVPPRFGLFRAGRMSFTDLATNMSDLVQIINYHVVQHKIKIETVDNGVSTSIPLL